MMPGNHSALSMNMGMGMGLGGPMGMGMMGGMDLFGPPRPTMNGTSSQGQQPRGGMADVFGPMSPPFLGMWSCLVGYLCALLLYVFGIILQFGHMVSFHFSKPNSFMSNNYQAVCVCVLGSSTGIGTGPGTIPMDSFQSSFFGGGGGNRQRNNQQKQGSHLCHAPDKVFLL